MKMFQDFNRVSNGFGLTIEHWPQVFMNTGLTQHRFVTSIGWIAGFQDCFYRLFLWLRWIENILSRFWKAILTSIKYNQQRKKLQCLYENQMSNNFLKTDVLKKYMNCKLKLHSKGPVLTKLTLTIKDCKGPQTNMPKNAGSIKTWSAKIIM